MEYEEEILLFLLLLRRRKLRERAKRKRTCWVRDIFRKRKEQGDYNNLVRELQLADREFYFILFLQHLSSKAFSYSRP